MEGKTNIPLIVGLAIPVLMIVFVAASIYLPGLFIEPQYNFVYATGNYPSFYEQAGSTFTEHAYYVRDGRLTEEVRPIADDDRRWPYQSGEPTLYLYDIATDTSQQLTLEEAQALTLDPNQQSPDGFAVTYGRSDGGVFPFVFWSDRDYNTRYLKGNNVSRKISVRTGSGTYRGSFTFIGWVVK